MSSASSNAESSCNVCEDDTECVCPCRQRSYCSVACQKYDWKQRGHKQNCVFFLKFKSTHADERESGVNNDEGSSAPGKVIGRKKIEPSEKKQGQRISRKRATNATLEEKESASGDAFDSVIESKRVQNVSKNTTAQPAVVDGVISDSGSTSDVTVGEADTIGKTNRKAEMALSGRNARVSVVGEVSSNASEVAVNAGTASITNTSISTSKSPSSVQGAVIAAQESGSLGSASGVVERVNSDAKFLSIGRGEATSDSEAVKRDAASASHHGSGSKGGVMPTESNTTYKNAGLPEPQTNRPESTEQVVANGEDKPSDTGTDKAAGAQCMSDVEMGIDGYEPSEFVDPLMSVSIPDMETLATAETMAAMALLGLNGLRHKDCEPDDDMVTAANTLFGKGRKGSDSSSELQYSGPGHTPTPTHLHMHEITESHSHSHSQTHAHEKQAREVDPNQLDNGSSYAMDVNEDADLYTREVVGDSQAHKDVTSDRPGEALGGLSVEADKIVHASETPSEEVTGSGTSAETRDTGSKTHTDESNVEAGDLNPNERGGETKVPARKRGRPSNKEKRANRARKGVGKKPAAEHLVDPRIGGAVDLDTVAAIQGQMDGTKPKRKVGRPKKVKTPAVAQKKTKEDGVHGVSGVADSGTTELSTTGQTVPEGETGGAKVRVVTRSTMMNGIAVQTKPAKLSTTDMNLEPLDTPNVDIQTVFRSAAAPPPRRQATVKSGKATTESGTKKKGPQTSPKGKISKLKGTAKGSVLNKAKHVLAANRAADAARLAALIKVKEPLGDANAAACEAQQDPGSVAMPNVSGSVEVDGSAVVDGEHEGGSSLASGPVQGVLGSHARTNTDPARDVNGLGEGVRKVSSEDAEIMAITHAQECATNEACEPVRAAVVSGAGVDYNHPADVGESTKEGVSTELSSATIDLFCDEEMGDDSDSNTAAGPNTTDSVNVAVHPKPRAVVTGSIETGESARRSGSTTDTISRTVGGVMVVTSVSKVTNPSTVRASYIAAHTRLDDSFVPLKKRRLTPTSPKARAGMGVPVASVRPSNPDNNTTASDAVGDSTRETTDPIDGNGTAVSVMGSNTETGVSSTAESPGTITASKLPHVPVLSATIPTKEGLGSMQQVSVLERSNTARQPALIERQPIPRRKSPHEVKHTHASVAAAVSAVSRSPPIATRAKTENESVSTPSTPQDGAEISSGDTQPGRTDGGTMNGAHTDGGTTSATKTGTKKGPKRAAERATTDATEATASIGTNTDTHASTGLDEDTGTKDTDMAPEAIVRRKRRRRTIVTLLEMDANGFYGNGVTANTRQSEQAAKKTSVGVKGAKRKRVGRPPLSAAVVAVEGVQASRADSRDSTAMENAQRRKLSQGQQQQQQAHGQPTDTAPPQGKRGRGRPPSKRALSEVEGGVSMKKSGVAVGGDSERVRKGGEVLAPIGNVHEQRVGAKPQEPEGTGDLVTIGPKRGRGRPKKKAKSTGGSMASAMAAQGKGDGAPATAEPVGGVQNTETGAHTDGLRTTVVSGPTAVQGGLPAERCAVVDNLASGTGERDETPGNSARNGQLDSMHAGDVYTDSVPRHEGTAALTDANGSSTVGASTVTAIVQGLDEDGANNRGGGVGVSTIPGGAEGDGVDASLNVSAMPHGNSDTHVEGKVVKAAKRINRRANLKKLPATMPPSYPEDKSNRSDGKPSSRTSVTNITTNDGNSARARGEGPAQRSLTYSHTSNAAEDSDTAFAQMLDAEINGRRTRRSRVPVTHNEKTSTVVGVGEKSRSAEGSAAGETTAAGEETATNAEGSTNREPAVKRTAATREKAAKRAVAIPRPGKVGKNVASATVESSANSVMAADECEKLERGMSTWVNTGMDTETDAGIRQLIETHTGTHGVLQDSKDVRNKANDRSEPIEVDAVVRMDSEGETVHDRTDALQVDEGPGETNHSQPHTPGNMTIDGKTDSHEYAGMGAVAGRMGGKTNNADPDLPQKGQVLTIPGDATGKARSQKHGRDTNNRNYNPHRQHWAYATYLPKATSTASEGEPSSENRSGRHGNGEPVGVLSKNTQTDRVIETPDVGTITAALNGTLNNTLARTSTTSILGLVAVDSLPTSKHTIANATNAPELESAQSSLRVSQPLSSPTPDYQAQGQYHRDQYQAQVKACTSRSKRARSAAGADEPALVLQNRRWSTRAKKPVEYQEPHIYDIGGVYAAGQPRSHNPPTKVVPEGTLELEKELEGRALVALTASDSESDYGDNSDEEDISVPETAVRPEGSLVPLVVEKHMSKLKAEPESGTGKSITGAGGGGKGKGAAGSGTQPQKKKKLLPKQINFILPIPPVTGHKSVTYGGRQEASTANKSGRNNPGRQTKTEKLIENTNYSADVALEVVRTINKRVLALDNNRGAGPSSAIALEIAAQVANEDLVAERNVVRQKKGKVAPPPGEKPYACRVEGCGKTFRYSQNLNAHRAVHTGVYPYPCTWGSCEHKFVSQRDLSRHTRSSHTFERPFKCPEPECGKCFPRADTLTIHQRTHTGEKPYICSWGGCNRACGTQRELVRHVRTHTGEKPFECPVEGCTRRFADASGRNQHERAHNKPYKCPYGQECDKSFASRAGLVQHLLMQHGLVVGVVTNVNN